VAQSIAGTSLAAAFASPYRTVTREVEVCWDGVNWTDETARALSLSIDHALLGPEGLPELSRGIPSTCDVALDNRDGRYSVMLAGSQANTHYPDGIYRLPIRVNLGYGGETLRQFTGEVVEAPGSEVRGARRVTFKCADLSYPLQQMKPVTGIYRDQRVDEFMDTLLTGAHGDDAQFAALATWALDYGLAVVPYLWADDENLWEQLGKLAGSEAGLVHLSKEGELRFWRATCFLERSDSTTSQVTLTRSAAGELGESTSWRNCYTKVIVEGNPWLLGPVSAVYQAQGEIVIPPGETVTHHARLRYLTQTIIAPQAGTDYAAVSAGGLDLSASLTVALTAYAQQAHLEITNAHTGQAVYVLGLTLRGYPLVGEGDDKQEYETGLVPRKVLGKKEFTVSGNHFVQTQAQMALLGSRLRDLLQRPRRTYTWRGPLCPWLELGDRVTLVDAEHGLNEAMLVMGLSEEADLTRQEMILLLLPVADLYPHTDYFVWGSSPYANANSHRSYY
jgi:hypothetical protein